MEYKEGFGITGKRLLLDKDGEEEEEEIENDDRGERNEFERIAQNFEKLDKTRVDEETLGVINELTEFSKIATLNYSSNIVKHKIFTGLIKLLAAGHEDETVVSMIMTCIAILSGKDYQDNSFFVNPGLFFNYAASFLENPNLANITLISLANIFSDQTIARNIFFQKFPPANFKVLIDNFIGSPEIIVSISRLIATCVQHVIGNQTNSKNLLNSLLYLLSKEEVSDNEDAIVLALYSIEQIIIDSHIIVKEFASNEEVIKMIHSYFTSHNYRIAEYAVSIISRVADDEGFNSSLIDKQLLVSLLKLKDKGLSKAVNKCIRSILINKRIFFYDDDYIASCIETIIDVLSDSSFDVKCNIAIALDYIVASSSPDQICRLVKCQILETLSFLVNISTTEGELAFLSLCKTILNRIVNTEIEVAVEVYDFFAENEIFDYAEELAEDSNSGAVKSRAETFLSAQRNLKQYIDEQED